jgi:choline transport protein
MEERKDARKDALKDIIWAAWIGAITCFIFLVAVCFCIVDVDAAATTPTGVPIFSVDLRVCHQKLRRRNGTLGPDLNHLSCQFGISLRSNLSPSLCFCSRWRTAILEVLQQGRPQEPCSNQRHMSSCGHQHGLMSIYFGSITGFNTILLISTEGFCKCPSESMSDLS